MAGNKCRRFFKGVGAALLTLALMACAYAAAVLLRTPESGQGDGWQVIEEQETVGPLQAGSTGDPQALARLFGAALPFLPGAAATGTAQNTQYDGALARLATLEYAGLTISAVRPAAAAPLLLRGELRVDLAGGLTLLNHPAMLAGRDGAWCLYFSGGDAAYAIYAPQATREEFLALLDRIQQTGNEI